MTAVTAIVHIATYPLGRQGPATISAYRAGAVVCIDDQRPWVLIGVADPSDVILTTIDGGPPQYIVRHDLNSHGRPPAPDLHWWACCPFAASRNVIGSDRRYGDFQIAIDAPVVVRLTCVVWPAKFFGPNDYQRMLGEIRAEFGWSIEWDDTSDTVRSRIEEVPGPARFADELDDVEYELRARRHWLSHRLDEELDDAAPTPEERLIASWALRRATTLAAMVVQLRRFVTELAQPAGGARRVPLDHRERFAALLGRAESLSCQMQCLAEGHHRHLGPFALSPAMQRDHRLRRLVRSFAQTSEERWASLVTPALSTAPPLKASHVFELWCAARVVSVLVTLGWTVRARSVRRSQPDGGAPVHSRVELDFGGDSLVVEFQPAIFVPTTEDMDDLHQRARSGVDVLGALHDTDGLISYGTETPDLVLMLSKGDGRRSFAIGDAALSDPERGGASDKFEKMIVYRDRIAWRIDGRVIRCAVTGTFVMLPGPVTRWARALRGKAIDSIVVFPAPGPQPDTEVMARVAALVELLEQAAT